MNDEQVNRARSRFRALFPGSGDCGVAAAPGRVNLIGEHTDYNDGYVLPAAIDRYVVVAFAPNGLRRIRASALAYETLAERDLSALQPSGRAEWIDYVAGVLRAIPAAEGLDLVIGGDVPIGSGLASSAALELATARAAAAAYGIAWEPMEMSRLARKAENEFVGVECGVMDPIAVSVSRADHALLLDCRSLAVSFLPLPPDLRIAVLDTATRRRLGSGAYNERRRSCAEAARRLGGSSLRDVDGATLASSRGRLDAVLWKRAHHVVTENERVLAMTDALRAGAIEKLHGLMAASHRSLREDYQVSSAELDRFVALAGEHPACRGSRMTGAGFGGCAVALVDAPGAEEFRREVERAYRRHTGLPGAVHLCRAVDGVRLIPG